MIISAATDYHEAARRKLPRFLFDYLDGGAYAEQTLRANVADLNALHLRQRVLKNVADITLETELFGETMAMPVGLGPVGLGGMCARRGEVQAARAARKAGVPYVISTVSCVRLRRSSGNPAIRCGSSFTCSRTAVSCGTRWSGLRRTA